MFLETNKKKGTHNLHHYPDSLCPAKGFCLGEQYEKRKVKLVKNKYDAEMLSSSLCS